MATTNPQQFITNLLEGFAAGTVETLVANRKQKLDQEQKQNELIANLISANPELAETFSPEVTARIGLTPEIIGGLGEIGKIKAQQRKILERQRTAEAATAEANLETAGINRKAAQQKQNVIEGLTPEEREAELTPGVTAAKQKERQLTNEERRIENEERRAVSQERLTTEQSRLNILQAEHANARDARDVQRLENDTVLQQMRIKNEEVRLRVLESDIAANEKKDVTAQQKALSGEKTALRKQIIDLENLKSKVRGEDIAKHKGRINRPSYETVQEAQTAASNYNSILELETDTKNALNELNKKPEEKQQSRYVVIPSPKSIFKEDKFTVELQRIPIEGEEQPVAGRSTGSQVLDDLAKNKSSAKTAPTAPNIAPITQSTPKVESAPAGSAANVGNGKQPNRRIFGFADDAKPSPAVLRRQDREKYEPELTEIKKTYGELYKPGITSYIYYRRQGLSKEEATRKAFGDQ